MLQARREALARRVRDDNRRYATLCKGFRARCIQKQLNYFHAFERIRRRGDRRDGSDVADAGLLYWLLSMSGLVARWRDAVRLLKDLESGAVRARLPVPSPAPRPPSQPARPAPS